MKQNPLQLCPNCDCVITQEQINIKEGVALCPSCGTLTRLSQLNYSGTKTLNALKHIEKGASISSDNDCLRISFSLFSIQKFFVYLGISLFWNGIVSLFVSHAAAAVYYNLFGPVPDWFPTPGLKDGI